MDRTDYQILNLLQRDCRATLKSVGDQVGLTAPAVSERVRRMEEKGIIRSFRIDVDRRRLDCGITGYILVAPEPDKYGRFCEFCRSEPSIVSHSHVISVAMDAPGSVISALSGKLGMLPGVSTKTIYGKNIC